MWRILAETLARPEDGDHHRTSALGILWWTLVVGLSWFAIEFVLIATDDPVFEPSESVRRFASFLPWQLGLFLGIGIALAAIARAWPAIGRSAPWFVVGASTWALVAPPLFWGLFRTQSRAWAVPAVVAVCALVAGVLWALARCERRVPESIRGGWVLAGCVGWSLIFLPAIRRAVPIMTLDRPDLRDLPHFFAVSDFVIALGAAAVLLAVAAFTRRPRAVGAAALAALVLAVLVALARPASFEPATRTPARADLPDIIMIMIDTMRADHLGASQDGQSITPALDQLAASSLYFERAYSPSNKTATAMPALMTGLSSGVVGMHLSPEAVTLAERLRDAGYATYGISANPIMSSRFGQDRGFDQLIDPAQIPDLMIANLLKMVGSIVPGPAYELGLISADLFYRPVSELRRRAARIAESAPKPLFLYLHTMDVHGPYLPPKELLDDDYDPDEFLSYFRFLAIGGTAKMASPKTRRGIENLKQRYRGEVRFTDRELAAYIEDLKAAGRWDDAIVWLVSDHGELFGEHGLAGHGDKDLSDPMTRVPMLLRLPLSQDVPGRRIDDPVSTRDVVPTTLALLELEPPKVTFGADLSPAARGESVPRRVIVSEIKVRGDRTYSAVDEDGRFKLFVETVGDTIDTRVLYDLVEDPGETENVIDRHPAIAGRLEETLRNRIEDEKALRLGEAQHELDAHTTERLRALGYVD